MRTLKHLTTWLLLLTVFLASGVVSAKVASGVQNLSGGLHQAETSFNSLIRQAKIGFNYDAASGSPVVPKSAPNITKAYKRPSGATTQAQRQSVQGKPCVDCGAVTPKQFADHKDPLVKEYYRTGTIDKTRMRDVDSVQPQCPTCSSRQGADLSRFSRQMKKEHGLE